MSEVLIEKPGYGYNQHYLPVKVDSAHKPGSLVNVYINGFADGGLRGEIL